MEYKVQDKAAFTVVGIQEDMSTVNGENITKIPQMWQYLPPKTYHEILELVDTPAGGILGVCANMQGEGFEYWIGAATSKPCPPRFSSLQIPAATWVVFEAIGSLPTSIQKLWVHIYAEWFPASGFEHADAPDVEWYPEGDTKASDYMCQVWVPVAKL